MYNALSFREVKDGLLLSIFVKPNSAKFKVDVDDGEVVVYATQEPDRGKVNKEIMKEFSKLLGARVELAGGFTSKQKQLLFKGVPRQQLEAFLIEISSKRNKP